MFKMAHILIVDDSPTETHIISTTLEKQGHKISTAVDGKDGVEKATEIKPDLILMDVVMPELNGFQATRQLNKQDSTAHIPVIMVTTKDQKTDKMWAERQGAKGYITKPFVADDLIQEVNRLLLS
jgi:twitching motility two-component system response regulator PilH